MTTHSSTHSTDLIIIGAGPVGLFAIFEAGMMGMRCHVIDTLDTIGGQCTALYPEKPIYDIPAHPAINAQDLITKLESQAKPFEPVYHLNQQVTQLKQLNDEQWQATTNTGTTICAKAVIIAAGCGAFGPNRPPLEGIENYEGTSVHYMVTKRKSFEGKQVVIAGGGDSAVDWALSLHDIAKSLYVVHRRPKFRCAQDSFNKLQSLAQEGKIELVIPYQLSGLEGNADTGQLTAVEVKNLDGSTKLIQADCLLPFFGLSMELGPIANWGLNIDKKHISVHQSTLETSQSGIYAIGDIATYEGKLKLILCGFSEAAMACHHARNRVFSGQNFHFEYSTTSGVPTL